MNAIEIARGISDLERAALERGASSYRRGTLDPLIAALESADSFETAQQALGTDLLARMDTDGLANDLAEAAVVAAAIGTMQEAPAV